MTGVVLAAASGVGFGLFQAVNVRAVRGLDPYVSTFLQVVVAAGVLTAVSVATDELSLLWHAPWWSIVYFAAAGLLHFLGGWTMLNLSQKRIGAARTSPLLTTSPLWGLVVAAVTLGQLPGPVGLVAVAVMVGGAWTVATRGGGPAARGWLDVAPGLGCALCWAVSPVLTVRALEGLDSPLVGVAIGLVATSLAYGVAFSARGMDWRAVGLGSLGIKVLAGVLVAGATWGRWAALDFTDIGIVLALNLLSVPVVLVGAPLMAGRAHEHVTNRVWLGAGLLIAGSLILIAAA